MMADSRNAPLKKPRRSHSFGGCDTCRKRHVKCDQIRPTCLTCKAVGVDCAGYSKDLKWVTSKAASTKTGAGSESHPLHARRHLYSENSRISMTAKLQSDLASRAVDESISELETRSKNAPASVDRSHTLGPFRVLDFTRPQQPDETPSITTSERSLESLVAPADLPDTTSPHTDLSLESLNNIDDFLDWPDLFELDFSSPDFAPGDVGYALPAGSLPMENPPRFNQLNHPHRGAFNHESGLQSHDLPLMADPSPPETSLRNISPTDAQILLKHFNDQVIAQVSSLPPGDKPHWSILNVRSAVLTLANVTFVQISGISHAAVANLMALLAISAHHLAYQTDSNDIQAASHWRNIGEFAIAQAKEHLRHSLKTEVRGPNRTKYKDQVMALSAMLAFAVLYDKQQDARAYIVDTEQLLRIRGLAKPKISRKVRMLHHLYTWSRIVGESSYVLHNHDQCQVSEAIGSYRNSSRKRRRGSRCVEATEPYSRSGQNPKLDDFLRLDSDALESDVDPSAQKGSDKGLRDIHLEDPREWPGTMYLQWYGISETWLSLVSQTTRLANIMDSLDESKKRKDMDLLDSLERRKQRLEHMVCSFVAKSNPITSTSQQASEGETQGHEVAPENKTPRSCMVRALSSALVIFFCRRILKVHPWILQEHVDGVVQALQGFDITCQTFEVAGPGSPWPAFMAGCEAIAPRHRNYLSQWLERAFAKTGFPRFNTIKSCMLEVWEKRDVFSQRKSKNSSDKVWSWIDVSREQKYYMMLS